eukprot:734220-Rhodomonas_salina.1
MAAVTAQAAQVAAQTAQLAVQQQLLILQQMQAQQAALLDATFDNKSRHIGECARGAAAYNPWAMTVLSKQAEKSQDWVTTLSDADMIAHPNYPPDAPIISGDPAGTAAAQAEVVRSRLDAQTAVHELLISTCSESYFAECKNIPRTATNCRSVLWRAIYLANNPDSEE